MIAHVKRCVLVLLVALLTAGGCGYGEVSSTAYEYAKALYNISNRRLADRLDGVERQIAASRDAGDISAKEEEWLQDIVAAARRNEWSQAMKSSRQIMEDQITH